MANAPSPSAFDAAYYRRAYRDYARQNPPRKLRFYAAMAERHLAPGLPRRIHDIGCGFGGFLATLAEAWEICGSDISSFAVEQAVRRVPRGAFEAATATDPAPFPGTFGIVTAFDVLEHVADLDAVAAAVNAQLAPGGAFLFVVPVYDGLSGPIIRALDRDATHVHKWPRRRWLQWAEAHWHLVEWLGLVRYLVPLLGYLHWPTRRLRHHAPAILAACRKKTP